MPPTSIAQRRTHNLLLLQKLLNLRDGASPFTLLLDSLECTSHAVVGEFAARAKTSKSKIIFVSFRTHHAPKTADVFIRAHGKALTALQKEITSQLAGPAATPKALPQKSLVIIDSLNPLAHGHPEHLSSFLSSLLGPSTSLLAAYHTDIVLPANHSPYAPEPLMVLTYLATAILSLSSLEQTLKRKEARDRSLPEPVFGLEERKEGAFIGLRGKKHTNSTGESRNGVVVTMEVRRKSGRGMREVFVLSPSSGSSTSTACLLDDHPLYKSPSVVVSESVEENEEADTTFNLGLTEKQRKDREGVVLPYFDAQKGDGPGEGGRILYEMGKEDDWDDEEDEI